MIETHDGDPEANRVAVTSSSVPTQLERLGRGMLLGLDVGIGTPAVSSYVDPLHTLSGKMHVRIFLPT